jgi:hypothetical protein
MSAGPLRGRIRPGDELRGCLAGRPPGSLIQGVEIFPDGSARPGNDLPVDIIRPGSRALLVGIGSKQAGIDSNGIYKAPNAHALESEALVRELRACRMPNGSSRRASLRCSEIILLQRRSLTTPYVGPGVRTKRKESAETCIKTSVAESFLQRCAPAQCFRPWIRAATVLAITSSDAVTRWTPPAIR